MRFERGMALIVSMPSSGSCEAEVTLCRPRPHLCSLSPVFGEYPDLGFGACGQSPSLFNQLLKKLTVEGDAQCNDLMWGTVWARWLRYVFH